MKQHLVSPQQGKAYYAETTICYLLSYGALAGYVHQLLPLWAMALLLHLVMIRWMIAIHESFHILSASQLDPISRLLPLPFTPFNIGYAEYRRIHLNHHQHPQFCCP